MFIGLRAGANELGSYECTDQTLWVYIVPTVSIVVPFVGLTNLILRNLKGNPKKELQWRL